jgi:signal peptidase II
MGRSGSKDLLRLYAPLLAGALVVIAADQTSKSWAVSRLGTGGAIEVVGPLEFRLAFNSGMAFSQGEGKGLLISVIGLGIVGFLLWTARTVPATWMRVVMGAVAGGALGNIIDRAVRDSYEAAPGFMKGKVVDFIYSGFWPTFNIADSAIVVGGIVLAVAMWRMGDVDEDDATPSETR